MASGGVDFALICDLLLILVFLVATASNSLVLLVFYRKPGLRTLSNRFVINLLATNLLSCWLLLPLVLSDSLLGAPSQVLCALSQAASHGLSAASVLSVHLIAVDQYYAVIDPLHYHSHIDNTKCAFMIAASWSFSVFCASMGGLFYDAPHSIWGSCGQRAGDFEPFVADLYISLFSITYSIFTFLLPFLFITWMYLSIYFAAHKNSQRTRRNGSSTGFCSANTVSSSPPVDYAMVPTSGQSSLPSQASTSDSPKLSVKSVDTPETPVFVKSTMTRSPTRTSLRSTSSFLMNSLRCRISNASMFKYREETRAARISALVIVMGLLCWCPYSLVVLLNSPLLGIRIPHGLAKLSVTLLVLTSVISPLLFAHRNRRIQRDLRKLFGLARRPTSLFPSGSSPRSRAPASQRPAKRTLLYNYSQNALEFLGRVSEAGDEHREELPQQIRTSFLSRVWWKEGSQIVTKLDKVSGMTLMCVPEVVLDVDNSRSSFSSGGSASTQRSTSATSISSFLVDDC